MDLQQRLLEPKLAYARAALLFDKPQEAAKVLDGIKGLNRRTSEFLELRAEQFLARARTDLALEVYRELLELHPEDRRIRAKLAALELQNGPEQVRDSARAALESLASDEEFGAIALRALTKDALRRQDLPAALSWSGAPPKRRQSNSSTGCCGSKRCSPRSLPATTAGFRMLRSAHLRIHGSHSSSGNGRSPR
jgi:hypothetical protein